MNKFIEKLLCWPLTKLYAIKRLPGLGNIFLVVIGSLIMGLALSLFLLNVNNNLVIGIGGLSRIIESRLSETAAARWISGVLRIDLSFVAYWTLSSLILVLGAIKKREKENFVLRSFVSVTMVSIVILPIFRHLSFDNWSPPLPESLLWIMLPVSAAIGGFLLALGVSVVMAAGGSTCGPDLFAVLIGERVSEKRRGFAMKCTMRGFDTLIVALGVMTFRPDNLFLYVISVSLTILILSTTVVSIDKLSKKVLRHLYGKANTNNHAPGTSSNTSTLELIEPDSNSNVEVSVMDFGSECAFSEPFTIFVNGKECYVCELLTSENDGTNNRILFVINELSVFRYPQK